MRFSVFPLSALRRPFGTLAHSGLPAGSREIESHDRFIYITALGGFGLLVALAIWVFHIGKFAESELLAALVASTPMLIAIYVSRTGRLIGGQAMLMVYVFATLLALGISQPGLSGLSLLLLSFMPIAALLVRLKHRAIIGLTLAISGIVLLASFGSVLNTAQISQALTLSAVGFLLSLVLKATLQQQAEQIITSSEQLALVDQHSSDVLTIHDRSGATHFASSTAISVLGVPAKSLLKSGLRDIIHLQDRVLYLKTIADAVAEKRPKNCRLRLRKKSTFFSDDWTHIDLIFQPFINDFGAVSAIHGLIKIQKGDRRGSSGELPHENRISEQASLQRKLLSDLEAGISQPLIELISREQIEGSQSKQALKAIKQSVDDIIDETRLNGDVLKLNVTSFALTELLDETCLWFEQRAAMRRIELDIEISGQLPRMRHDRNVVFRSLVKVVDTILNDSRPGTKIMIGARQFGRNIRIEFAHTAIDSSRGFELSPIDLTSRLVTELGGHIEPPSQRGATASVVLTLPLKSTSAKPVPSNENVRVLRLENEPNNTSDISSKPLPKHYLDKLRKGENHARLSA